MNQNTYTRAIGIIGGVGSFATADLFAKIIHLAKARTDQEYPRVFVDNNPGIPDRTAALKGHGPSPVNHFIETAHGLMRSGAGIIGIPCNTAHAFLADIQAAVPVPILSIVDESVKYVVECVPEPKKVAIVGTDGTRLSGIYDRALAAAGIVPAHVDEACQRRIMDAIYGERGVKAGYLDEPREVFTEALRQLASQGVDAVMLACTEIAYAVDPQHAPVTVVDTTGVLASALLREARRAPVAAELMAGEVVV